MATFSDRLSAIEAEARQDRADANANAERRKAEWGSVKAQIRPLLDHIASRLNAVWNVDAAVMPKNGNGIEILVATKPQMGGRPKPSRVHLRFTHSEEVIKCTSDNPELEEDYEDIGNIDEKKIQEKLEAFYRHVLEKLKLI